MVSLPHLFCSPPCMHFLVNVRGEIVFDEKDDSVHIPADYLAPPPPTKSHSLSLSWSVSETTTRRPGSQPRRWSHWCTYTSSASRRSPNHHTHTHAHAHAMLTPIIPIPIPTITTLTVPIPITARPSTANLAYRKSVRRVCISGIFLVNAVPEETGSNLEAPGIRSQAGIAPLVLPSRSRQSVS